MNILLLELMHTRENCCTQYSKKQFSYLPSYPTDNHQYSDAIYCREQKITCKNEIMH